jgi:hypothetical protein
MEIEIKLELDADGAARAIALGTVERRDDQLNVYFDDAWRLSASGMTVRVRFTGGAQPVLTAKILKSWEGFRRTMEEIEMPLVHGMGQPSRSAPRSIDVDRDLTGAIRAVLVGAGFHTLHRVGWVRNLRTVVALPGGDRFEVDRTRYPDGSVMYEVEIETDDRQASDRILDLVQGAVPTAVLSQVGKYGKLRRMLATE